MKRIWRKMRLLILAAAVLLPLTGCIATSAVEDLFTLPQPPLEYTDLSETISALLADGYEYAAPSAGQHIQSVQIVDLDWDGRAEALAFFRKPADDKPLKILVFQSHGEAYELLAVIESSGTSIERVEYEDMNADGVRDLVVGWKGSADVQNVAVYAVGAEQKMLMQSNYTRYTVQDLDGDGIPSLLVMRSDTDGASVAEFYGWRGEAMTLEHRTTLSSTMAALNGGSVVSGSLNGNAPAVFVTGINEQGMAVTDILHIRENGTLNNAALSRATGLSGLIYPYRQLQPQDLDGDGVIEIPAPRQITLLGKNDGLVDWMQCDAEGQVRRVATTYHCLSEGWYLALPEAWNEGEITTVAQTGLWESQVTFRVGGEPVAAIYAITGENRESRALQGNRTVLRRQTDVVYSGEIMENVLGYDNEQLHGDFHLIVTSWGS